jgi:hypothetical protein
LQAAAELHGLLAISRFTNHLEVGLCAEQLTEREAQEGMVVCHHDPCMSFA